MRISSLPLSGIVTLPTADGAPAAPSAPGAGAVVQFGQPAVSLPASTGAAPQAGVPVRGTPAKDASLAAKAPASNTQPAGNTSDTADAANEALLDNSEYSNAEALKRWEPLVAQLPPEQRLQAEKALNRPMAAARMAAGKGPEADAAMAFINANPALKAAVDVGKSGGEVDGKITHKDLKAFAKNMEKAANKAADELASYQSDHPDADPQSLEMARSAALLQANLPLIRAAAPNHAQGAAGQQKVDGNLGADDLNGLARGNGGLATSLQQACSLWAQPGLLGQLDQAGRTGRSLAAHSPDQLFDSKNISRWLQRQAPSNGAGFASMLSDAATLNAVAGVDISGLDGKVFEQPGAYTGKQKAAVMVKLQQTQQSVVAGRGLRNTQRTEAELAQRISQLQADPDVQAYLQSSVPAQERAMVSASPSLQKAVNQQARNVNSGQALRADMAAADQAAGQHSGNADYSGALDNLQAQVQLQRDLFPGTQGPTAQAIVSSHADVQAQLSAAYTRDFAQGTMLTTLLGQKKTDAASALQTADARKALYDSVLPNQSTAGLQPDYQAATLAALSNSKKGRALLEGQADAPQGQSVAAELAAQFGPSAVQAVMGFASVSDMLAQGNKLGAAQTIYDSAQAGAQAVRQGVDAGARLLGREASGGLGRMAGQLAGRAAAMVAGEATGMAAGAAVGAAVPIVGWAIDGAMALGLGISAIVAAVKKHHAQKAFDHNVDPVLDQFGIARAH